MLKKQIILATKNQGKVREIKRILGSKGKGQGSRILSLLDFSKIPRIVENGKTFEANAIIKAKTIAKKFQVLTLADDSGLEVEALNGAPGVKSARFAGPNPTKEKLCKKLLCLMKNKKNRKARFVCAVAVVWPDGKTKTVRGIVNGRIGEEMEGEEGFGYDPVFIPRGWKKTFAQMKLAFKNRISHRGNAFRKAGTLLSNA